jgi:hypothetical protein
MFGLPDIGLPGFGGGEEEQATEKSGQEDGGILEGVPLLGDLADVADDAGLFRMAGTIGGNALLPGAGFITGPLAEKIGDEL